MYVTYEDYITLYGEKAVDEVTFNRLLFEAERRVNIATTGIDGIEKLKIAFPEDEYHVQCVKHLVCNLINIISRIEEAEENVRNATGYITREDGAVVNKVISSVSSGSESISYATQNANATLLDKALADVELQERMFRDEITKYLSGVRDSNGVNLLYMGEYPCITRP